MERIAGGLGLAREEILDAAWLVNGPQWIGIRLSNAERCERPAGRRCAGRAGHRPGRAVPGRVADGVRGAGAAARPVTGRGPGDRQPERRDRLLAAGVDLVPDHYIASQGTVLGRVGRVHIDREGDDVWIGGRVVKVISGDVFF